jgi:potassium/hydrogen antiporter
MENRVLQLMLGLGIILIFSVLASKTTNRIGVPVLLIFIVVGMLSGSDGLIGIPFDDAGSTRILGTIALIFILFSGGVSTHLSNVVPIWREGVLLASLGVLLSTALMGFIIHWVMNWGWIQSALLAATISSTDAAAVFGILKSRKLSLRPKMQAILELESGSNDPMAVFLTLSFIHMITQPLAFSWSEILMSFFIQMSLGALTGWFLGLGLVKLINWLNLEFEGLYPVLTIAGVITIYSLSEYGGGNGFLSVYLAGLAMSREKYFSKKTLEVFHDGLAWLMQVAMFLALGLLVQPSEIPAVMGHGIILALALIFLVRPIATWLCLWPFKYRWREIWFLSWGGIRGAVPIILATYFLVEGVPASRQMFNLVFLIVIITMLIQGSSIRIMSKWMKVQETIKSSRKLPFKSRHSHSEFIEFFISSNSPVVGRTIFELNLPKNALVVLIHRQGKDFIPRGNTQLQVHDRLVCLAAKTSIPQIEEIFGSEHFFERKLG